MPSSIRRLADGKNLRSLCSRRIYIHIHTLTHKHTHTHTHIHTHDNTINTASKDLTSLLEILKSKLEEATNWIETNHMLANPDKF